MSSVDPEGMAKAGTDWGSPRISQLMVVESMPCTACVESPHPKSLL